MEDAGQPSSLAECAELFRSGRCDQTALRALASASSPLVRPLPLLWGSFKDIGNYDLYVADASTSHHCTIQAFRGPTLGICLPRACPFRDYLRRHQCEEQLIFDVLNATAALVPALANTTAALAAISQARDNLAVKTTSFCAEDARYAYSRVGPRSWW